MKSISFIQLALSLCLCVTSPAFASNETVNIPVPPSEKASVDTSTQTLDYLDKTKAAYSAERYTEALDDLAHAQNDIRVKHAAQYRALLPGAPDGWKAQDNTNNSTTNLQALGGITMVGRSYSANGHSVGIVFIIDAPSVVINAMMTPPATTSTDVSAISFVDVKGNRALYKESVNAKTGLPTHALTLSVSPIVVMVSSSTLGKDTLAQFASIVDYEGLRNIK